MHGTLSIAEIEEQELYSLPAYPALVAAFGDLSEATIAALERSTEDLKRRTAALEQLNSTDAQPSALDRQLTITRFPNKVASSKRELPMSLRQFAALAQKTTAEDKGKLPYFKLARFGVELSHKKSLRTNANLLSIDGIEGDYDGEAVPMAEAAALLRAAGIAALLFTTASHTPDKPRWRVLVPTSATLPPDQRERLCARLNGALGGILAGESFILSQSYCFGSVKGAAPCQVELVEGKFLDLMPGLDAGAIGKDGLPWQPREPATKVPVAAADHGTEPDLERIRSALAAISDLCSDYGVWLEVGMILHHETKGSDEGLELWHDWSQAADNYDAEVLDGKWDTFNSEGNGKLALGTLYRMAKQHGWPDPGPTPLDPDLILEEEGDTPAKDDGISDLAGLPFNEDGVALAFTARFKDQLRFDHHAGQWFQWVGTHWQRQETKLAFAWARKTCRDMARVAKSQPTTSLLAKAAVAAAVERFAQADEALAVTSDVWDRDPWLLGTPGGTVELQTGKLRPAQQSDMMTKLAGATPAGDCPTWLAFLDQATGRDAALVRFLQQWCGYSLTGDTREQALLFIYGPGGNGKSVFLKTVEGVLGGYSITAGMEVFSASKGGDRHPQELARLKGARMVSTSETEEGRAWHDIRIKQLTGGDTITARFMRQNDFQFQPEFKLTAIGNSKPVLHRVDAAMRRRMNFAPFEHKPVSPDLELEAKLRLEWPGILAWMIRGCLDWQGHGLVRPQSVLDTTADYFANQDTFGQWLDECCETGPGLASTNDALFHGWSNFAGAHGETALLSRTKGFPDAMRARGFESIKNTNGIRGRGYRGVRLVPGDEEL